MVSRLVVMVYTSCLCTVEMHADAGSVAHPRVVSNALPYSVFTLLK